MGLVKVLGKELLNLDNSHSYGVFTEMVFKIHEFHFWFPNLISISVVQDSHVKQLVNVKIEQYKDEQMIYNMLTMEISLCLGIFWFFSNKQSNL